LPEAVDAKLVSAEKRAKKSRFGHGLMIRRFFENEDILL
jgi:hypothetical protein